MKKVFMFLIKALWIYQDRWVKLPYRKNGKIMKDRLNPFNPLSYVLLLIVYIISFFLYGILGTKKHLGSPLKWLKWN